MENQAEFMKMCWYVGMWLEGKPLVVFINLWWFMQTFSFIRKGKVCFYYTSIDQDCNKGEIDLLPAELHEWYIID